ncbi:MAG: hypothetical protein KatS3mg126_0011 [Lysobacteraceae bacterium]|nr:MAG: hypothetical protein KatS3mg126_0011 [Xanthomonadaceae bacterium]
MKTTYPDGSLSEIRYAGLATTIIDQNGHARSERRNALGELVQATDAAGLTVSYAYAADGGLESVSRDGGRGALVTRFVYDALGRKIRQSDPDAGVWSYAYNAAGELIEQVDAKGNRIVHDYDARGRMWRTRVYDANGALESTSEWEFDTARYGLGLPARESIRGIGSQQREYVYDALGRWVQRDTLIDGRRYRESTQYDALGRAYKVQDATGRWAKTEYNARGYALRVCDSSAADSSPACSGAAFHLQVEAMDARGHVTRERRGGSEGPLTTRTYDPHFGRLETVCSGSACSLQNDRYEFDAKGNLVRRQRDLASPAGTREHFYIERFRYDAADRLVLGWNEQYQSTVYGVEPPAVDVHRAPPANLSFYAEYDALGNLCRKTSWSTVNRWVAYHYQGASGCGLDGRGGSGSNNTGSGHKLSALEVDAGGPRLWVELDANGNHISGGDGSEAGSKVYRYTGRNQVSSVHEGSELAPRVRVRFAYGADGARYLRIDDGIGQAERRTTYVGGVERIEQDGAVSWRRPVAGVVLQEIEGEAVSGGITVAGSRTSSHQLYFDHLGSVVLWVRLGTGGGGVPGSLFADSFEDGPLPKAAVGVSVVKRFDYGPHGEPRPLGMARLAAGVAETEVPWRGFTGHEHIDALSTIHMGGRIYDPLLGRFLQPDPIVQSPWEGQNWNPYAYVLNNPLSFTDPSGLITLKDAWRTVVGIVVAVYAPQFFATYMKMSGFWSTVAAGFSSGVVTGGSLKGGVYGAFSAGAFYGVGSANWPQAAPGEGALGTSLTAGALAGKTVLHGLVGGVMASLQGGKFGHGFVSAGITQLSGGVIDCIDEANPGTVLQGDGRGHCRRNCLGDDREANSQMGR